MTDSNQTEESNEQLVEFKELLEQYTQKLIKEYNMKAKLYLVLGLIVGGVATAILFILAIKLYPL